MTTAYGERINIQKKHHVYRKKTTKKHQEWIQINDSSAVLSLYTRVRQTTRQHVMTLAEICNGIATFG